MESMPKEIIDYAESMTSADSDVLKILSDETNREQPAYFMMSSHLQGKLLQMLVALTRAEHILEIGMYTGFTALSMAEALGENGTVTCLEADKNIIPVAQKYFDQSAHGHKIEIIHGLAKESLANLTQTFDMVFIDADKQNYPYYYEAVLPCVKQGGLIVLDNMFYGGEVLSPKGDSAKVLAKLNQDLLNDTRVEVVLLPIRDGLSLVYKK